MRVDWFLSAGTIKQMPTIWQSRQFDLQKLPVTDDNPDKPRWPFRLCGELIVSQIVIPKDILEATLHGLKDQVEFVDESGEVLGQFTPAGIGWMLEDPIPPIEELDRRAQGTGRTLAEIKRDWERLAS